VGSWLYPVKDGSGRPVRRLWGVCRVSLGYCVRWPLGWFVRRLCEGPVEKLTEKFP
jgi:hypothetical protein